MSKRTLALLGAAALLGSLLTAGPTAAQEAPVAPPIPAEPNIVDPVGDANFINGSTIHPAVGNNNTTPVDASSIADLKAVWFTNDAKSVSAHIQTELPPPGGNGVSFNVFAAPGEGGAGANAVGCIRFFVIIPGTNPGGGSYQGPPFVKLHDRCNTGGSVFDAPDAEFEIATAADGTGIVTITAPREVSPLFADGSILKAPTATSSSPTTGADGVAFVGPAIDNTNVGTDYTVTAGGGGDDKPKPPEAGGPGEEKPKDKCKGLKGKKKKKCKKKENGGGSRGACPAYAPGEQGAEAETTLVTDAATEEAPVTVEIDAEPGFKIGLGQTDAITGGDVFTNVQVDSKAPATGLYVRLEWGGPPVRDYDMFINNADGSRAASSHGFNPNPALYNPTDEGGNTETLAEQVSGLKTSDCQGYTTHISTASGEGGTLTLSYWLGEVKYEAPKGEG